MLKHSATHNNTSRLWGRSAELNVLQRGWRAVRLDRQPRCFVVAGDTGIGKTALLNRFVALASEESSQVTVLRGFGQRVAPPYAPWAQALTALLSGSRTGQHAADHIAALMPLPPALRRTLVNPALQMSDDARTRQYMLFAEVRHLLARHGPLIVAFDEADDLDDVSLYLIRYLLQYDDLPLMLMLLVRDVSHIQEHLDGVVARRNRVLRLGPLGAIGLTELLNYMLAGQPDPVLIRKVQQESAGNPLFAEEYLSHLVRAGAVVADDKTDFLTFRPTPEVTRKLLSTDMASILMERLVPLSAAQRHILSVAGLIGPVFDAATLSEVLGGEPCDEALQVAQAHDIIQPTLPAGHFIFRPPELSEMLVGDLMATDRRIIHERAAAVLCRRDAPPAHIARHYSAAGQHVVAASYFEQAGAIAAEGNAFNAAARAYRSALSVRETVSAYEALGRIYREQGRGAESVAMYQQALRLAWASGKPLAGARLLNELALVYWLYDQYDLARQAIDDVLRVPQLEPLLAADALSLRGMVTWLTGHLDDALTDCEAACDRLAPDATCTTAAAVYDRLALVRISLGHTTAAETAGEHALALRREARHFWGQAYSLVTLARLKIIEGQYEVAISRLKAAETMFQHIQSYDGLLAVYTFLGQALLWHGEVEAALARLELAARLAEDIGKRTAYGLANIHTLRGHAWLRLGNIDGAAQAARQSLRISRTAGTREALADGRLLQAITLAARTGRAADARVDAVFATAIAGYSEIGALPGKLRAQVAHAAWLAHSGRAVQSSELKAAADAAALTLGVRVPDCFFAPVYA